MGGVVGGAGGNLILERAREVLADYGSVLTVDAPDERVRQLGQSVAAAALPQVK